MAFSVNTRGRCWIGTVQEGNMIRMGLRKDEYENPENLAEYLIKLWESSGKGRKAGVAVCVSEKGLYHAHMALYGNTTTLKKVSKIMCDSHIEPQLGGKQQLTAYLLKEPPYNEKGEMVLCSRGLEVIHDNHGKRKDLEEIEDLLNDGYTPEEIFEISFRYRKFEKMIKAHYLSMRIKNTPLIKSMWNEYHFGASGSGKTYTYKRLCDKCSPEQVYLCNDYSNFSSSGGGFDFYVNNPAEIIMLDEFRGEGMTYTQLLTILDVYSRNQQHCRYQNTYNLWTSVYICSIYPPEKLYSIMVDDTRKSIDSMKQLMRRLNIVAYHYVNKNGKYRVFEMPACDYVGAEDMIQKARENEKNADEIEQIQNNVDISNTKGMDMEQFKNDFGASEVKE